MSASDLISRAACFFVLAERSFRLDYLPYTYFWDVSAPPVVATAPHLPAMAAFVRTVVPLSQDLLWRFACHPLPGVLPPEAVPWHTRLVAAWEVHRTSNNAELQNPARLALVRLDGCGMPDGQERPSRLAEWLAEAQKIASGNGGATGRSPVLDGEWRVAGVRGNQHLDWDRYREIEALAALAAWRPAPRVVTPPETLWEWVAFWMERRQSDDPVERGIAVIALLNLPEADLRAASISPVPGEQLLKELAAAIPVAAQRTVYNNKNYLLLLDWQPVTGPTWPITELRNVAQAWLDVTGHDDWIKRRAAWQQLIRWDRAGRLAICGMDLLPELVKALQLERDRDVLWEMARWVPSTEHFTSVGTPGNLSQLQQLKSVWEQHKVSFYPSPKNSAWLAGLRLRQAGLDAEPPESFLKACISKVAEERSDTLLFILAQWPPGPDMPERWYRKWNAAWQQRLRDEDRCIWQVAAWALLRQSLEKEDSRSLRCTALELWRAGTKASSEARDMLDAAFSRFQEVRARLAAGEVPDFEEKPAPPAERHRPPPALPPGRIVGSEWKIENREWNMENDRSGVRARPHTREGFQRRRRTIVPFLTRPYGQVDVATGLSPISDLCRFSFPIFHSPFTTRSSVQATGRLPLSRLAPLATRHFPFSIFHSPFSILHSPLTAMPASDLISRAARFFVLAEQASRLDYFSYMYFWDLSAPPVVETASHLPAMAAAVRTVAPLWEDILLRVASHPLPGILSPEAVPWYNRLVAAWEVHRTSGDASRHLAAHLALVRLDGCGMPDGHERPSRLPEWLAEAQKIASGEGEGRPAGRPFPELEALAALAAWHPAPQVITPPETLREWAAFWLEMQRSEDPVERGIAAIALLNLPEAALRAASIARIPVVDLLPQVTTAIQVAAERTDHDYLSLLDWQPVTGTAWPVEEVRNVAQTWLEVARHEYWENRRAAWRQLIRWDRAGSLDVCGINLLPELVQAVQLEKDGNVLWEMAQWEPGTERFTVTGMPDRRSLLQQLEEGWERHRVSVRLWSRAAAWLAGIGLHQAGLASEPQKNFLDAYLSQVADEQDRTVLFILAQWSPATGVPGTWQREWNAAWRQRLLDKDESIRQIAAWALLRQSLEKEPDRSLRGAVLGLWRVGTKASSEASQRLDALFERFQEVQARLAAGEVVDFGAKPARPAERLRPPLTLPPGCIAGSEWQMENEELKMNNGEWRMQHQEVTPHPRLVPDCPSRSGISE